MDKTATLMRKLQETINDLLRKEAEQIFEDAMIIANKKFQERKAEIVSLAVCKVATYMNYTDLGHTITIQVSKDLPHGS